MRRPIRARMLMTGGALGLVCLAGCGLQKKATPTVLKSEDFIGDPGTMPTQTAAAIPKHEPDAATHDEVFGPALGASDHAAEAPVPPTPPKTISVAAASDGMFDVLAVPGMPDTSDPLPAASGPPELVDAKVGELNGRPIRAADIMDDLGPRLAATAKERKLTADEWEALTGDRSTGRPVTRTVWLRFARRQIGNRLERMLGDELMTEEARFSLKKPEEKQGLKYFVEQMAENKRRASGGTNAEMERKLKTENKTIRQYTKDEETTVLIQSQIIPKLWKRTAVSWKDIRQFYEKHPEIFNPPAKVYFRLIQVPAKNPADVEKVRGALASGKPFAEVAAMQENTYNRAEGGKFQVQTLKGEYADATFFTGDLSAAAKALTEGHWNAEPVDFGTDKTWVFLEKIERKNLPLSDRDVQLGIQNRLNNMMFDLALREYLQKLKANASISEMDIITARLTDIAAARYWPEEN